MKITDYKGREINYNLLAKKFEACDMSFPTQSDAEGFIDKLVKSEQSIKLFPAILCSWGDNRLVDVTSIVDDSAWVTSEKGRSKERLSSLFHATPENLEKMNAIIELNKEIKRLERMANGIKFDNPVEAK